MSFKLKIIGWLYIYVTIEAGKYEVFCSYCLCPALIPLNTSAAINTVSTLTLILFM